MTPSQNQKTLEGGKKKRNARFRGIRKLATTKKTRIQLKILSVSE
jgi:hypothetical protein